MFVPIEPDREYRPMEIKENGWILNNNDKPDYFFVLKLIKLGRLNAKNVCLTGQKYFKVRGSDIIKYRQERYGDGNNTNTIANQPEPNVLPQNQ